MFWLRRLGLRRDLVQQMEEIARDVLSNEVDGLENQAAVRVFENRETLGRGVFELPVQFGCYGGSEIAAG